MRINARAIPRASAATPRATMRFAACADCATCKFVERSRQARTTTREREGGRGRDKVRGLSTLLGAGLKCHWRKRAAAVLSKASHISLATRSCRARSCRFAIMSSPESCAISIYRACLRGMPNAASSRGLPEVIIGEREMCVREKTYICYRRPKRMPDR
jgi:hypothetical protein